MTLFVFPNDVTCYNVYPFCIRKNEIVDTSLVLLSD